jgi:integrase
MICSIFKQRRRIDGVVVEAETWSGRLRMPWDNQVSTVALRTADQRVAFHRLMQLKDEREKEHNGIIPPKPVREAASRSLSELLEEYLLELQSRGRRPKTISKYRNTLKKLFGRCRWVKIPDVTTRSFCQWRNTCGLTGKTTNDLLAAAMTFFEWLEHQRMLMQNPLKYAERVDTRGKAQYRRALAEEEVRRLIETAPRLRSIVYLMAVYTGLRRNELNLLKWGDLHLDGTRPIVCAPASITKNKKEARLPLRPEVVDALRSIRPPDAAPFQWVFHNHVPRVRTFQKDLSRAGIVFVDDSGRRIDFHSLRVTFCTLLAKSGVPLAEAMKLMRHSDPKLTMGLYLDASQLELNSSLSTLPVLIRTG